MTPGTPSSSSPGAASGRRFVWAGGEARGVDVLGDFKLLGKVILVGNSQFGRSFVFLAKLLRE